MVDESDGSGQISPMGFETLWIQVRNKIEENNCKRERRHFIPTSDL